MSISIRDVKRRIGSVGSTKQMTQALKAVAVTKHNRAHAKSEAFRPYGAQCRAMLEHLGSSSAIPAPEQTTGAVCFVLVTANRGMCGSFNTDVFRYYEALAEQEARPHYLVLCGRWGEEYARQRHLSIRRHFDIPDLPEYSTAQDLCTYLTELYRSGEAVEIVVVSQQFRNVLRQIPAETRFLPKGTSSGLGEADQYEFLPDKAAVLRRLTEQCLTAEIYECLLTSAEGAHAAMLVAMRAATDSSTSMLDDLMMHYNRLRQAAVTAEVLELSSSMGDITGG